MQKISFTINHKNNLFRSLYEELTRPCFAKQANSTIPYTAIIPTLFIFEGMHYLKFYYSHYNLFIHNIDISLQEMMYTTTIHFITGATWPDWLFLVACLSTSITSAAPLWEQTKLKYIIFMISIILWIAFSFYIDIMFTHLAKMRFFDETTNTSIYFPRVTGTIDTNKVCDDETKTNLENGCYFLIMKDKQTFYLLLDPTINHKWTWEQNLDNIKMKSYEICVKKYQPLIHNFKKIQICSQNEFDNAIKIKNQTNEYINIEKYVTEIQQSIKTVQIPTTSLGTLTTLPMGSPINNACKQNTNTSNHQNQSSVNAKL